MFGLRGQAHCLCLGSGSSTLGQYDFDQVTSLCLSFPPL